MLIHFHIQEGALYPLLVLYRIHVSYVILLSNLKKNQHLIMLSCENSKRNEA